MRNVLLVVFTLLFPQFAWGANTNIQNGDSNLTTRQKLNVQFDQQYNVKNAPYNAVGDGSNNDYNAINSAISDACAAQGGIIYFPPGTYHVGTSLTVAACNGSGKTLTFKGAGRYASVIDCNLTGYCIDKPDDVTRLQSLVAIEGIGVNNSRADPAAGAIRLEYTNAGTYIRDCDINGYNGITAAADMFTVHITDCNFNGINPYAPGGTGVYISQGEISNVKFGGWETAIVVGGYNSHPGGGTATGAPPTHIHNVSIESTGTGILVGQTKPPTVTASISGATMTVTNFIDGPDFTLGQEIIGATTALPGGTTISACPGGNCGAKGNYTLNQSAPAASQTITAKFKVATEDQGLTVESVQTEAVNTPIMIWSMSMGSFSNLALTVPVNGTIQWGGGTVAYSAANGGTFTFTFPYSFGLTGSHPCWSTLWNDNGYNFNNQTCDFTGGNVVTITGRGASPANGTASGGGLAPAPSSCVVSNKLDRVTFNAIDCNASGLLNTAFDFTFFGLFHEAKQVTLQNMKKGQGFTVNAADKAAFTMINSPDFVLNMAFADLPASPSLGQQYFIIDANTATIGANVTAGGSPNTKGFVVWNGLHWTLMSN